MKYNNPIKGSARGWSWNRICERIRTKDERRRARVFVLIGDTTEELRVAQSKGFSHFNVIGVDLRPEPVKAWREAGGLAIQAPIEVVVSLSKVAPQAVIADFCGGITDMSVNTFLIALLRCKTPGCVVMNMLRGRDQIEDYRCVPMGMLAEAGLDGMGKKRSTIILLDLFRRLYREEIISDLGIDRWPPTKVQMEEIQACFNERFDEFKRILRPDFHEYKSVDSNQYFDSLAVDTTMRIDSAIGDYGHDVEKILIEILEDGGFEMSSVKRRMAALEAVRTQKLNELKPHYRPKYEAA
tara:strand:- start:215 stop:1105 length:891 start_codon:yes stop_codon:yes gene_type:complete